MVILSKMQNISLKPVQLVDTIITCGSNIVGALICDLFHLSWIDHFIVLYNKLYQLYWVGCRDYRKCMLIGCDSPSSFRTTSGGLSVLYL